MAVPAYLRERSRALENGIQQAASLHDYAVKRRDQMAAGSVDAGVIHDVVQRLRQARQLFLNADAIPNFWAYVQAEYESMTGDTGTDVSAEFGTMMTELEEAGKVAMDTIPQDADGYLLERTWNTDGTLSKRMFTPSETATLQTKLDDLVKSIDVAA